MNQELISELNLALIPENILGERHIALSRQIASQYPAVITLNGITPRLAFTPHLTIYQVAVRVKDLDRMREALGEVASSARAFALAATEYSANPNEGSFEVRYEAAPRLMQFQDEVLAIVNPLRGNLLVERDPSGRPLSELMRRSGTVGDNVRRTGFDAVGDPAKGGTFGPHVTINWLRLGTSLKMNACDWPQLSDLNGHFVALGIFVLGPYGTCAQRLATLELQSV
jgi:2'-5' RNA ligase